MECMANEGCAIESCAYLYVDVIVLAWVLIIEASELQGAAIEGIFGLFFTMRAKMVVYGKLRALRCNLRPCKCV